MTPPLSVRVHPRYKHVAFPLWIGLGMVGLFAGVQLAQAIMPEQRPSMAVEMAIAALPPLLLNAAGLVLALALTSAYRRRRMLVLEVTADEARLLNRHGAELARAPLSAVQIDEGYHLRYGGSFYCLHLVIGERRLGLTSNSAVVHREPPEALRRHKQTHAVTDADYALLRRQFVPGRVALNTSLQAILESGRGHDMPLV
ncbi:MAG: hypothetical protein AB8I08_12045 [Sandaracinaceae bacterium]